MGNRLFTNFNSRFYTFGLFALSKRTFFNNHCNLFTRIFVLVAIAYIIDYLKYKDETEEERAERLKLEEMLDKWRKQFK